MYRLLEYGILFFVMVILQVFLFSRIGISIYVNPLVYIAFLILLPMEIAGALLLVLGMVLGMTVDFFMGTAGINTIATLFAAFCRPAVLTLLVGKDEVKEGGVPNVNRIGLKRSLRYAGVIVLLHGTVFFVLESLTWSFFYLTLLRIICSSVITLLLVYFCQKLFAVNRQGGYGEI